MSTLRTLSILSVALLTACGGAIKTDVGTDSGEAFEPGDGGSGDGAADGGGADGAADGGADGAADGGADGAADGGTDGGSDGGSTGGSDGGSTGDLDGVYSGGFVGSFRSDDGSISDTCTGSIVVDVNTASSIPILSNVSCTWGGLMATLDPAPAFSFDGTIGSDGSTVGGAINIPTVALTTTWSGTISPTTVSGSYTGAGTALGLLAITFDGNFTATR